VRSDPLSELLTLVRARCTITGGFRAAGQWAYRFPLDAPVKLDAVVQGSCWLIADDEPPVRLATGDAVVLNHAESMVLCSNPRLRPALPAQTPDSLDRPGAEDDVVIIGGHIALEPGAAGLFTSALPRVTHAGAAAAEAAEMRRVLGRIMNETSGNHPGASFAADQYAQLLLLQVLRAGLRGDALSHAGWLRLFADAQLRPAVSAMHAEPARAWGLADLAAAAGMSRSHFAYRFREVSGQPPLTYLTQWRIGLGARALRESDTTVAALAERLGYASESSFSHAFARITGTSPGQYRRNS
jgi:AraC-like DNA-binding protein